MSDVLAQRRRALGPRGPAIFCPPLFEPRPSSILRECWCKTSVATCAVHVLGKFLSRQQCGERPFAQFGPVRKFRLPRASWSVCGRALQDTMAGILREALSVLGVEDAEDYILQDFRRGAYKDMKADGKRLVEILVAAGVRSARAPQPYLDQTQLEMEAVMEAHLSRDSDNERH